MGCYFINYVIFHFVWFVETVRIKLFYQCNILSFKTKVFQIVRTKNLKVLKPIALYYAKINKFNNCIF